MDFITTLSRTLAICKGLGLFDPGLLIAWARSLLKTYLPALNLAEISANLRAGRYVFSKLRAHAINKPGSNKPRPLQIASVRDRVVMKSIALYIEPVFRRFNLECSFAFIKGRGVKPAIERIHDLVEKGNKFYFE